MPDIRSNSLRVIAADDSAVMRGILRTLFLHHAANPKTELPQMELIGVARDGQECIEAVEKMSPDVLVLDLEMPRMSGLEVLDTLQRKQNRIPVIMCSSLTEKGAQATLEALSRGALDYVMKPAGQRDFQAARSVLANELLPRIAAVARRYSRQFTTQRLQVRSEEACRPVGAVEVLVIGVSTGGPAALEQLLPKLPADLPVPVMMVQHMPKVFTGVLAERLNRCCSLKVAEAVHGEPLVPGTIWIAPGDMHMEIMPRPFNRAMKNEASRGFAIKLHQQEPLNHCRPSVDYLFRSAALHHAAGSLAVILTGMGSDGLDGALAIRSCGGAVLAQDESTSAVWGMPGRVVESGAASAVLPLPALAREIVQRVYARRTVVSSHSSHSSSLATREGVSHGMY